MLKQQYAGSLTQSSVRATFADSLSQYSKHSDDMGGHGTDAGVYSNKKTGKAKNQKKLPDLNTVGYNEQYYKKPQGGGFASDGEELLNQRQLPMIGGSIHAQNVADAYVLNNNNQANGGVVGSSVHLGTKGMKKNQHNSGFNQSKYISGNASNYNNS